MSLFDNSLFKEVFITGPDYARSSSGTLSVFDTLEDLVEYLRGKMISISSGVRVLHGYLTPAAVIPKNLRKCVPFIIVEDPTFEGQGMIHDSDGEDYEDVAMEIESVLDREEVASSFADISHIFILYGYELSVVMTVDEEELSENRIKLSAEVSEDAKKLYKRRQSDVEKE